MKHGRRRCGTERFESKETRIRRDCVEPADHLVENGASLLGDSAVLLGGLVDAVWRTRGQRSRSAPSGSVLAMEGKRATRNS